MPTDNKFQTDDQNNTPENISSSENTGSTAKVESTPPNENDFELFLDKPTEQKPTQKNSGGLDGESSEDLTQEEVSPPVSENTAEENINLEDLQLSEQVPQTNEQKEERVENNQELNNEVSNKTISETRNSEKLENQEQQNQVIGQASDFGPSQDQDGSERPNTDQESFSSQTENQSSQANTQDSSILQTPQENISFGATDVSSTTEEANVSQDNPQEDNSKEGDSSLSTDDAVNQILSEDEDESQSRDDVEDITQVIDENTAKEEKTNPENKQEVPQIQEESEKESSSKEFQPTSMSGNMNLDQMVENFNNQSKNNPQETVEINGAVEDSNQEKPEKESDQEKPKKDSDSLPVNPLNITNNASDTISLGDMQDNSVSKESVPNKEKPKIKFGLRIILGVLILILGFISAYVMFPDLVQNIKGANNIPPQNNENIETTVDPAIDHSGSENTGDAIVVTGDKITEEERLNDDEFIEEDPMEVPVDDDEITEIANQIDPVVDEQAEPKEEEVIEEIPFEELSYEEKLQQYIKMGWDMGTSGLEMDDEKMITRGNIITKEAAELLSGIQMSGEVDFELLEKYFKKFDYLIEKNNS